MYSSDTRSLWGSAKVEAIILFFATKSGVLGGAQCSEAHYAGAAPPNTPRRSIRFSGWLPWRDPERSRDDNQPVGFKRAFVKGGWNGLGRNRSSVKNQVVQALRTIDKIGTSKRQARKAGDKTGIHGTTYKDDVQGSAIRFVQYAKENHGIKNIFQLRPDHHKSYMAHLDSKGLSKGYMINVESHLQKFQTGMTKMSESLGKQPVMFFEGRTVSPGEKEGPRDRSYTREAIEAMMKHMSKRVATASRLGHNLGLRNREVCNLRVEHVQRCEDGRLEIRIENGKGVTKGGRFRNIPVPQRYENELRGLITGKEPGDRIIPISEKTMRNGVAEACKKAGIQSQGTHGFRHTYARERVQELIQERIPDRESEAHWALDRLVENYHGNQRMDSGMERDLYDDIKGIVDTVHSDLGHGEGRWDLFAVYMG
ncbi:tyrosine-type recombinase/integrase [Brevibacillus porteri]|uniref:tyrosine-type recombinase/integrase n=1 Tax=Brevibacillus porteri TaxID=2126350 RepID=UPI003D1F0E43